MKQAIEEGFILDVLKPLTRRCNSYYRPGQNSRRAIRNSMSIQVPEESFAVTLRATNYAIQLKAEIMVDHFRDQVLTSTARSTARPGRWW